MDSSTPFQQVRWHVPVKILGIQLPPGYHIMEAPLQLFLCYGDEEVAVFSAGTDPTAIEREAAIHFETQQRVPAEDPITELPWSITSRSDAARLVAEQELHAIAVRLTGLDALLDLYGYKAVHSLLRQISRGIKRAMDGRDRLTRHSGDTLLIFTTRTLEEIQTLVELIHRDVAAVGLETDGERLPRSRIGVATADRVADPSLKAADAVIDAIIISAEAASASLEEVTPPPTTEEPPPGAPPEAERSASENPSPAGPPRGPLWVETISLGTPAEPAGSARGSERVRLQGAGLDVSGLVATATVKLAFGDREVIGKSIGRNVQERRLLLAAEAAARAVTEFLPTGHGVMVQSIQPVPTEVGKALWTVVLLLTPHGEETLLGIAPLDEMVFEAAGKAVLSAVNRRIAPFLGQRS